MATSRKKKAVGKDDLKRLMKEQIATSKSSSKRIDSPLAKYNSVGHLSCIICHLPVKSEMLWNAHIQSRTHKESITRLKEEKSQKEHSFVRPASPPGGTKRKLSDLELLQKAKHMKADGKKVLPKDFIDTNKVPSHQQEAPKSILRTSSNYHKPVVGGGMSGIGGYDSSGSEEDDDDVDNESSQAPAEPAGQQAAAVLESGLPTDFFDAGINQSSSADAEANKSPTEPPAVMSEKLPEGFFDDPKMDAKVRKVEFVDKMDEEWALFQRAMKDETTVSEAILAEDDEEANEERNLAEVEEQLKKWSKIDELAKRKEAIKAQEKGAENLEEDEGSSDELDEYELDDWRAKTS